MSTGIVFCSGILIGSLLGAVGMFLLIKETALDLQIERELMYESNSPYCSCKRNIEQSERFKAPELDTHDDLEMPRRR